MKTLVSAAARAGTAMAVALLVMALARWAPVHAEPLLDVRALAVAPVLLVLGVLAALTGREAPRRPRLRPQRVAAALGAVLLALAATVALRPPSGLEAAVASQHGPLGTVATGPIEINGPRLRSLPFTRRWHFTWSGPLRAPQSGRYRLWATGRGRLEVTLDGRPVFAGEGDPLRSGADVAIGAGAHALQVTLARQGAGPRLRLGWTRPDGVDEAIPPRALGAPLARAWWWATDALAWAAAVLAGLLAWTFDWTRRRRLPAPGRVTGGEFAASLVGHAALFVLMSWPLARDPAHLGVMDRPDGRLNAWILAWGAHALVHAPDRLFDAPAFHPLPDALAFSESMLLPAALVAPFQAGGPVLAYNVALALAMIGSALAAQLLARSVSGGRLAGFVGGALFGVGAHRWIRLAHLQAQWTVFLPLLLLACERFWRRRTLGRALAIGALVGLQALSSIYVSAVGAVALAAVAIGFLAGRLAWSGWLKLAAAVALAVAVAAPAAVPYMRMRTFQGMEWTEEQVATYATTLESYAASGTRAYGRFTQAHLDPERVNDTLFPGLTLMVLGLAGLAVAPARWRAIAVLGSALAIVLSLGPATALYRLLHEQVVLVRGVRALSRLSLLPVLALCALSALALARARWTVSLAALALALVESANAPLRYARDEGPTAAARWLKGGQGAVVVLPAGVDDTRAMLDGVAHFRPLVNGDSGFVPRPYSRALELLDGADRDEALRFLRAVGVTHAVSSQALGWPVAAELDGERVYAIPPGPQAAAVPAAAAVPTLWSDGGATADLGKPRLVGSLAFELDERPWLDAPAVDVSEDGRSWTRLAGRASLADAVMSLQADPRHGRGQVHFAPSRARFVRLDPRLPARAVALATSSLNEDGFPR